MDPQQRINYFLLAKTPHFERALTSGRSIADVEMWPRCQLQSDPRNQRYFFSFLDTMNIQVIVGGPSNSADVNRSVNLASWIVVMFD